MAIKYYKLLDMLNRKGMQKEEFRSLIGISSATMSRISANKYISMETLDKICEYLKCQPGDIMEHVKVKK